MALSRRNLLGLFVADVVIFVLSNVVTETNAHPGTASNVLWVVFLIGFVVLIVLCVLAAVQSMRSRRASA
jgi:zinc transporter ZupT